MVVVLAAIGTGTSAAAGPCDALVKKADTVEGTAAVTAYTELMRCDGAAAEAAYDAFMKKTGDVGALVDLSLVAIRAQAFTPVWGSLEKIPDVAAREEVAIGVGSKCQEVPEVVTFLKGAFYGLRGRQFVAWSKALHACSSEDLVTWMAEVVAEPPPAAYDEKYDRVVSAYVKQQRMKALPTLERAAVAAATNGGPFSTVIEKMEQSVQPVFGEKQTDEEKKALEGALVKVANAVVPEQAAMVADRLYNSGNETAAASLLPRVYPDRVQPDGRMLYAAAAIEHCGDEAVVHYAAVLEPAKRWSLLTAVDEPMRAMKARLKCERAEPWPVVTTPEPIADRGEIESWVGGVAAQWNDKATSIKTKAEKDVELP